MKSLDWEWDLIYLVLALVSLALIHYLIGNNLIWRFHEGFNRQFEKLRNFYGGLLDSGAGAPIRDGVRIRR